MSSGRKRAQTGAAFEAELDLFHTYMEHRGLGKIRRNYIPTRMVGAGKRIPCGVAHVDRTGWVSVVIGVPSLWTPTAWHDHSQPYRCSVPVAFDAKVNREKQRKGWYFHDQDEQHQLHDLKAAAEAGEFAFLLILERAVDRIFAVPVLPHYVELVAGKGVQLWDGDGPAAWRALRPCTARSVDNNLWNWIPLLQHCAPMGFPQR